MHIPTFLMSTSKEFGIVEDGKFKTIYRIPNGVFFGITWDKHHIYVLSRNGQHAAETIEVFDKSFNRMDQISLHDICSGGHQLFLCPKSHRLHLMNTNKKLISVFEDQKIEKHIPWLDADECTHINSIWSPNGDEFYVMEHNGCNPPSVLVKTDSDMNVLQRWSGVGFDCHCIHIEDDVLTTASSKEFAIVRHCLKTNTRIGFKHIKALGSEKWYTRGLGVGPDYMVLGLSAHQDIRERRLASQDGGAVVLDPELNIMHEIAVGGRGQILDLRLIDDLDMAHNGIPF